MFPWKSILTSLLADNLIRLEKIIKDFLLNEYINPPWFSSLATSFIKGRSSEEEAGEKSHFAETVGSGEDRGLEINEESPTVSLVLNPRFVLDPNLAAREGVECERKALEEIAVYVGSHADCQGEETSEGDSFVDIMGSLEQDTGVWIRGIHICKHPAACRFVVRDSAGGYCWYTWYAIVLVFILHSMSFLIVGIIKGLSIFSISLFAVRAFTWRWHHGAVVFFYLILSESLLFALRRQVVMFRAVSEQSLWENALPQMKTFLASLLMLPQGDPSSL